MEQTFAQLSQQFLEKAARQYGAPFEIQKKVTCCGIEFPMTAGYIKRDGRHFLGIKSNLSQDGMCGETCYFLCRETLTSDVWQELCAIFQTIHDRTVPTEDPAHVLEQSARLRAGRTIRQLLLQRDGQSGDGVLDTRWHAAAEKKVFGYFLTGENENEKRIS